MGIPELWDQIKEHDHSVPLAQLAEEHYQKHGRPIRVAVDEADWRHNNLTPQQIYIIRDKSDQPAFQGIEKAMFWRICRWLTLNIQPLFVFDGPRRPWKRGRRGAPKINYDERKLLKEMLQYMRIPYHEAPGEAEAECARLQVLGIVDAVFSQDSDSLMFGCTFLIRDDRVAKEKGNTDRSKENTKKSGKSVKVIRGNDIERSLKLDREGLVLFAMLVGGDYDMKGLDRCGSAIAMRAVRAGLGKSLCHCRTTQDCLSWREELVDWLMTHRGRKYPGFVPIDYPDIKTLDKYNRPIVSTDEELCNLRGLRHGWDQPIDEVKLLWLTSSRFNIWGKGYMNWIGPILLIRALVAAGGSRQEENKYQIRLVKSRAKKDIPNELQPKALERKVTFSPFGLTSLTQEQFDSEADIWWGDAKDVPFDPTHRVECELPTYWLEKGLPLDVLEPPRADARRKRNVREVDVQTAAPTSISPPKRQRVSKARNAPNTMPHTLKHHDMVDPGQKSQSSNAKCPYTVVDLISEDETDPLEELDFSSIRTPAETLKGRKLKPFANGPSTHTGPASCSSDIIDLGTDERSSDEEDQLRVAMRLSLQGNAQSNRSQDLLQSGKSAKSAIFEWEEWEPEPESLFVPAESPIRVNAQTSRSRFQGHQATAIKARCPAINEVTENQSQPAAICNSKVTLETTPHSAASSAIATCAKGTRFTPEPRGTASSSPIQNPTSAAELRSRRLRHFEGPKVNKALDIDHEMPFPTSQLKSCPAPTSASKKPKNGRREIECIDLTDL